MTRFFFDTEFIDASLSFISAGLVREDGKSWYWVNGDDDIMDTAVYDNWLRPNVVKWLPVRVRMKVNHFAIDTDGTHPEKVVGWDWDDGHLEFGAVMPKKLISLQLQRTLLTQSDGQPEIWAWYSAYDYIMMSRLFGRMVDHPPGIPMLIQDLKQECLRLGDPQVPAHTGRVHHALDDAFHDLQIHRFLAGSGE